MLTDTEQDTIRPSGTAPRRLIFSTFVVEHSKFAYFLLAVTAAAIVYALDNVMETPHHRWDCLAFVAVILWMLSFGLGWWRIKNMLVKLYEPLAQKQQISLGDITQEAGTTADYQFWTFVGGIVFYGSWVLASYYTP